MLNFLRAITPAWRYTVITFFIVIIGLGLFGYHGPGVGGDADVYWGLASRFRQHGTLSLLNFDSALRGYLFPLLLMPAKAVVYLSGFSQSMMSIIIGAIVAALLFGWALPELYRLAQPNAIFSPKRRLVFIGLGLFFWSGYFNYTLTDFPAILTLGVSMLLLLRSKSRPMMLVLSGIMLGATLNFRPVYLISVPFLLLLAGYITEARRGVLLRLVSITLVVAGMALPLLPQWYINRVNFGKNTPLVLTKNEAGRGNNLVLSQLGWGLDIQKFETAFGSAPGKRNAVVFYLNPTGQQLLNEAGYQHRKLWGPTFKTTSEYISLVMHHPVQVTGVYLRQLFNGLDQHHSTPYVRQPIQRFTWILPVVNYSLWFGVLLLGWSRRRHLKDVSGVQLILLLSWVAPCAVACLMAMENRFLLPVHLLLYALISFEWNTHTCLTSWKRRGSYTKVLLGGLYVVFLVICFAFSWSIHQQQYLWPPQ